MGSSVADQDVASSSSGFGIPIYSIDSYTGKANANIGRVNPNGNISPSVSFVGNTSFNLGLDAITIYSGIRN